LKRGDVAFLRNGQQLFGRERTGADMVEVRFRGSKGDQERKGAVLVRVKGGQGVERDEGAVALLAELVGIYDLPEEAPLMTYRHGEEWKVWERERATKRLREGVGWVGQKWRSEGRGVGANLDPAEFSLHSGRIGGATRLALMGIPFEVIKNEGRWKSEAFRAYVRANFGFAKMVSGALEAGAGVCERQPGQGTLFGRG